MTITTKFNIGEQFRHAENGVGTITAIWVDVDDEGTTIGYSAVHSKRDSLNADHYYESEIEGST